MKKYQIAILVVAIVAIVGVAMFAIPINHHVTYEYLGYSGGSYSFNKFVDGNFVALEEYPHMLPVLDSYTYSTHSITWQYPNPPTFDFSWIPFVN